MSITYTEIDMDDPYDIRKLDILKFGKYDDKTYYKLFDINNLYSYKQMIIHKTELPSYKPKKNHLKNSIKKYYMHLIWMIL